MYISYDDTEKAAESFLNQYHLSRTIPVPIEQIVEIDLGITVIPRMNLLSEHDIDAFLSHDFKELYIDHHHYMGQTNRARFTLAHEVGHYVLHQNIVSQITDLNQWKRFILGEGTGRAVYEIHADNFAGCLLMPKKEVTEEFRIQKDTANKKLRDAGMKADERLILSFIANEVSRKFDVSQKAAEIRLSKLFLK